MPNIKKKTKSKTEKKKKLVLLDAHAILHRAYHALPDFTSNKGEPTGALYGLTAMLMKIIEVLKPDYMVACYDLPEPTFRHDVYKEYKGGRAKTDDELIAQMDRSRDIFRAFNVPIYEKPGFEADDILGTIVEQTKDIKNLEVIIASGDMDTLQLVHKKQVQVYTLKRGINDTILYDEKAVIERFGFKPTLLPDYKGLRGDPSDNIIGIKGIGEKTGSTLIQTFGSIENIYNALKKSHDPFLKVGIKPRIIGLLEENEEEALFSKMLALIRRDVPITFNLTQDSWRESIDIEKASALFEELSFRTLSNRFKVLFGAEDPIRTDDSDEHTSNEAQDVDQKLLKETAVALWVLRSDKTNPKLEDILQFTNEDELEKAHKKIMMLIKEQKLEKVYEGIEKPLIPITQMMQEVGIRVDVAYLKKLSKEYHTELSKIEKRIYKHAGEEFNISSPKQLGEILFEKMELGVKNQKKTSTGQKSTKESELEKMKELHPIIDDILSYRELRKLLSTYIDNLPEMVGKDGRIHAEFLQTGTTTGRMASHNPNLQNIPIKTELGRRIRDAFVAKDGYELLAADYSQIELRAAALLSKDEKLIEVFRSGGDIHSAVASEVFGVSPDNVDREMRRRAKVINFGIIYGMGVNALRQSLGKDTTTRAQAQQFYNDYFKQFSGLAQYLEGVKADAARVGYTETYFGRKRYFEGIKSKVPFIRASAERMAINAPIQGTEADIVKLATINIDTYLKKHKLENDVRLLLNIHDELIFEVKKNKVKEVAPEIKRLMESVLSPKDTFGIVFTVDMTTGSNWGEMKKFDVQ